MTSGYMPRGHKGPLPAPRDPGPAMGRIEPLIDSVKRCCTRWVRRFGAIHEIEHECSNRAGHEHEADYSTDHDHRCLCGDVLEAGWTWPDAE